MEEKRAALGGFWTRRGGKRRANSPVGGSRPQRKMERRPPPIAQEPNALQRQNSHRSWPSRGENRRDEVVLRARANFSPVLRRAVTPDNGPKRSASEKRRTRAGAKTPLAEAARRGWRGRSSLVWRESDRARTGTSLFRRRNPGLASFVTPVAPRQQFCRSSRFIKINEP